MLTSKTIETLQITIDQSAIKNNYQILKKASQNAICGAAVKANAYGCGIDIVAPILLKQGCRDFFVADALEGVKLRSITPQASIYVLNGISEQTSNAIFKNNLTPVLNSLNQIDYFKNSNPNNTPFALHINTGMNRLGIQQEQIAHMLATGLIPELVLSHLACADEPERAENQTQLAAFQAIQHHFPNSKFSLSNSAGLLSNINTHFDLTRPGIALYGGNPFSNTDNPMQPVVSAQTKILDIRHVKQGEAISYGGTFTTIRDSKIAICGVGYADGLPRSASGHGVALRNTGTQGFNGFLNGYFAPCIGRITMDLTMFDVTNIPNNKINSGDWMELIGPNISLETLAKQSGTVNYEILTRLGQRYSHNR